MDIVGKSFVSIVVFAAVYLSSYWLMFVQIVPQDLSWLATGAAFLTAGAVAGLIWHGMQVGAPGVFETATTWAGIVGAVGFAAGSSGRWCSRRKPIRGRCWGFSSPVPWDWSPAVRAA